MKSFVFPEEVKRIFDVFLKNENEIMLVGGCIRDFLLDKEINDYDFATKYDPNETKNILKNNNIEYFTTGEDFGTITAVINDKKFEITTLRKDVKTDGRHTLVEFTDNYFEDAKRRDFTFNALYMDFSGKIYDFFNGMEDLKEGKIRFIGNAKTRIIEDNLRIFRFFRFYGSCAEYFEYNDLQACIEYKNLVKNLSKERITEEFLKILDTNYCVKSLKIMEKCGILQEIIGDITIENIEIFYSLNYFLKNNKNNGKYSNKSKYNNLFILALILSNNNTEYNNIKNNFALSNKKKKYIDCLINSNFKIDFNDSLFDSLFDSFNFEIKKLLFLLKDKNIVENIIIFNFCNKYKNIESFNNLKLCLEILENIDIPELDIRVDDLISHNFNDKKEFSKIINKSRQIYIESNFSLNKNEILTLIQKEKRKKKN